MALMSVKVAQVRPIQQLPPQQLQPLQQHLLRQQPPHVKNLTYVQLLQQQKFQQQMIW